MGLCLCPASLLTANPYIDSFILSQVDNPYEAQQSMAFGLWTVNSSSQVITGFDRKRICDLQVVYTNKAVEETEYLLLHIGISMMIIPIWCRGNKQLRVKCCAVLSLVSV